MKMRNCDQNALRMRRVTEMDMDRDGDAHLRKRQIKMEMRN